MDEVNIQDQLCEEIGTEFEKLKGLELGSEEHKTAVDGLTKLMDRQIEMEKLSIDSQDKWTQMKNEKTDRIVKNCLTAGSIVLPLGVTIWGTIKSIEFEKEGTITTILGRAFINKLLHKK